MKLKQKTPAKKETDATTTTSAANVAYRDLWARLGSTADVTGDNS
jgi:hypothetical protein